MRRSSARTFWGALAVVVALAIGVVGCGTPLVDESTTTAASAATTTTEAATTTTEAPSTTTTTEVLATTTTVSVAYSEELLANGNIQAIGLITDVWMDGSVRKLKIDYIDYFCGAEADAAALADGFIQPGEQAPNGWYMRNNNTLLRTYVVSDTVTITTYSRDNVESSVDPPCSWSDFLSFWGDTTGMPFPDTQIHGSKWVIERQGDTVVSITELWTP